jgi:hypothetical protein
MARVKRIWRYYRWVVWGMGVLNMLNMLATVMVALNTPDAYSRFFIRYISLPFPVGFPLMYVIISIFNIQKNASQLQSGREGEAHV